MRISCVVSILLSWLVSFYELIPRMFGKKKKGRKKKGKKGATNGNRPLLLRHPFIMRTVLTLKEAVTTNSHKIPKTKHTRTHTNTNTKQDATTSSSHSEMGGGRQISNTNHTAMSTAACVGVV